MKRRPSSKMKIKKTLFCKSELKKSKRKKNRIHFKKVYLWKKLYEGVVDRFGNKIKMTLQDAAEKVDISKNLLMST